ncbi:MAG: (2Fe-2S)-binding protein [Clostridiaceae bacterium]|nr:(2Fe-2S)-binding protein [Clostridiaceae bacterium]
MNKDKVICPCKKVTKGDILVAMKKGALTYKDVKKATGAGSKCGHCKDDVKNFIKKHKDDI